MENTPEIQPPSTLRNKLSNYLDFLADKWTRWEMERAEREILQRQRERMESFMRVYEIRNLGNSMDVTMTCDVVRERARLLEQFDNRNN